MSYTHSYQHLTGSTSLPRFHETFPSPSPSIRPIMQDSCESSFQHPYPPTTHTLYPSLKRKHDLKEGRPLERVDPRPIRHQLPSPTGSASPPMPFATAGRRQRMSPPMRHASVFVKGSTPARQRQASGSSISSLSCTSWPVGSSWASSPQVLPPLSCSVSSSTASSVLNSPQPNKRFRKEEDEAAFPSKDARYPFPDPSHALQQPKQQQQHPHPPHHPYLQDRARRALGHEPSRSTKAASAWAPIQPPSPQPEPSSSTLADLCFAIALDTSLTQSLQGHTRGGPPQPIRDPEPVLSDPKSDPHALRIVFSAPCWLQEHMAKARKLAYERSKALANPLHY